MRWYVPFATVHMTTISVQIGLLTVMMNQQGKRDRDFLDGLAAGMGCYYDTDLETRRATVADMIENFESISDETVDFVSTCKIARAWLPGFVVGWITGLNNPDLADESSPLSWADCLTRKQPPFYRNLVLQTEEKDGEATEESPGTEPLPLAGLPEA